MRLFCLGSDRGLAGAAAIAAGVEIDPVEEREFTDGEHKSRPLVSVRNEDVYVIARLHGHAGKVPGDLDARRAARRGRHDGDGLDHGPEGPRRPGIPGGQVPVDESGQILDVPQIGLDRRGTKGHDLHRLTEGGDLGLELIALGA